jgi:hypothetical protein
MLATVATLVFGLAVPGTSWGGGIVFEECNHAGFAGVDSSGGANYKGAVISTASANSDRGNGNGSEVVILPLIGGLLCISNIPAEDDSVNITVDQTFGIFNTDPGLSPDQD